MIHLGDITKISGYDAPIVDCVIGGSPCQDLSVAGRRAGLAGERSGLFMEQLRIVKEMRERDEQRNGRTDDAIRPRYMVWENVPGAFSSNKGEDFRIVLEEIAKVSDKDAVIPMPPKGKWTTCGSIVGDGWSIAWRVLDAQFWGVPQRRRRIALVADFGGQSAPEILFVRKGVSRDIDESKPKRKKASSDATGGIRADDCLGVDIYNTQLTGNKACSLTANGYCSTGTCPKVMTPITFEPGIASREGGHVYENVSGTLRANAGDNQMSTAYGFPLGFRPENVRIYENTSTTLCNGTRPGFTTAIIQPVVSIDQGGGKSACNVTEGKTSTLTCTHGGEPAVCYSVENHPADSRVGINEDGIVQALTSRMETGGGNVPMVMQQCFSKSKRAQTVTDNETWVESDTENTLNAFDVGDVRATEAVVYALDRASYNQGKNAQYDFEISDKGISSPLVAKGPSAVCYWDGSQIAGTPTANNAGGSQRMPDKDNFNCVIASVDCRNATEDTVNGALQSNMAHSLNGNNVVRVRHIARRLTPLECERLQGYPDNWTLIGEPTEKVVEEFDEDTGEKTGEHIEQEFYYTNSQGKRVKASDAARYKALGNSIALPPWKWVLKRLCACYERDATMASLFDGIGGFPYLWEQINGKGSCLWASEIEEFPIAVTKVRIGE